MIVSTNKGGLCNRIRCIASCIIYGQLKKIDYGVQWIILNDYKKNNHILNCPFNMLFKNKIEVKKIDSKDKTYGTHYLIIEGFNICNGFNKFSSKCQKKFIPSDPKRRNIDFMYNDIPDKIKQQYINAFKVLKPIDKLQVKIDDFSKKFNQYTISIHIRSWNRKGEGGRRSLFKINKFEDKMKEYDKKYNFYLASDSSSVINYFKNNSSLKDRILIYPRQSSLDNSRDFPEGVQEDLIELYLLSKNKILIGSHFSTFTEVAWWLAECPKNVIII